MVWLYVWVNNPTPAIVNTSYHVPAEVKASNQGLEQERKRKTVVVKKSKIVWSELSRSEIEELIDEWIFSERDRSLIKRRLLDAIGLEKLAEEFDLSVSQVKNIVRKCQKNLFF